MADADSPVRPRLLYATPTGTHPKITYVASAMALRMTQRSFTHDPARDFLFASGPVQMARCHIARVVLERGYDFVVMHDDDLSIQMSIARGNPLDAYLELMRADPAVGIVGAVYLRDQPRIPTVNLWHPDAKDTKDAPGETVSVVCGLPREPFECAGIGTGFMLIRAQVFRDIDRITDGIEPFLFWPYVSQWGARASMGEDFYFCWRAQQAGWKVMADPRFATLHDKDSAGKLVFDQYKWDPPEGVPDVVHDVAVPDGTVELVVNGIKCLDVSAIRRRDGAVTKTAA